MLELLTVSPDSWKEIVVDQEPILRFPLENNFNVYTKTGYKDYNGVANSDGTLGTRGGRAGIEIGQASDVLFSDRVFSSPAWTMCWWMYRDNANNWHNIGSGLGPGNANTMLIQFGDMPIYNNGYFLINYPSGSADDQWYRTRLSPTPLYVWSHFALTWDNGVLKSYKNGSLVATVNTRTFTGFGVYNWKLHTASSQNGLISNLMFYDKALDLAGIQEAMSIYTRS